MRPQPCPALAGCLATLLAVGEEAERPNILWVTSEDNGPQLGCYRYDWLYNSGLRVPLIVYVPPKWRERTAL